MRHEGLKGKRQLEFDFRYAWKCMTSTFFETNQFIKLRFNKHYLNGDPGHICRLSNALINNTTKYCFICAIVVGWCNS